MAEVDYMLCFACQSGDVRMVRSCLSSGADVNTTEIVGLTPLQIAMRNNHPNVIAELLNGDIDITAADGCGITILHWACWMGATELVSVLRNDSCMLFSTSRIGWYDCTHVSCSKRAPSMC